MLRAALFEIVTGKNNSNVPQCVKKQIIVTSIKWNFIQQ